MNTFAKIILLFFALSSISLGIDVGTTPMPVYNGTKYVDQNTPTIANGLLFLSSDIKFWHGLAGQSSSLGIGTDATLASTTTALSAIAIGDAALSSLTEGNHNTAIGISALFSCTTGAGNVAIGNGSLQALDTGGTNTVVGYAAGNMMTSGSNNTIVGQGALHDLTDGTYNLVLGLGAAANFTGGGGGAFTSGNYNIVLGASVTMLTATDEYSIVIGSPAQGEGDYTTVIGTTSTLTNHIYGARIVTPVAMAALAIDVNQGQNTKTISADSTFTFSATPATGQWFSMLVTNSAGASKTLTIPSSFSVGQGTTITSVVIQANGKLLLTWNYDGSVYNLYGDPPSTTGTGSYVLAGSPTITGHPTIEGVTSTGATGSGAFMFGTNNVRTFAATSLADDTYSGDIITGYNAGEALSQWDVVYLDSSSTWKKADNDGTGTYPAVGIAVASASSSAAATIMVKGVFRDDGGTSWTVGSPVYLSATAGAMTSTAPTSAGTNVQHLGTALSAHVVYFNPSGDYFTN